MGRTAASCLNRMSSMNYEVRSMGYNPDPPQWKEINYVIHIHHTDSFPDSYS